MDTNPNPRLRAQAAESHWFLLFACVVLLAPPLLAAVVAKRPIHSAPAADVSGIHHATEGVAHQEARRAPHPVAGAPSGSAAEG